MSRSLPQLTTADIRQWTSRPYYQRGLGYFQDGRVLNKRREGRVLKARCQGSRPSPYRIEVTLVEDGIESARCSCPVASAGCKHVVAVLLTWIHESDTFTAQEDVEARLRRSPAGSSGACEPGRWSRVGPVRPAFQRHFAALDARHGHHGVS